MSPEDESPLEGVSPRREVRDAGPLYLFTAALALGRRDWEGREGERGEG